MDLAILPLSSLHYICIQKYVFMGVCIIHSTICMYTEVCVHGCVYHSKYMYMYTEVCVHGCVYHSQYMCTYY